MAYHLIILWHTRLHQSYHSLGYLLHAIGYSIAFDHLLSAVVLTYLFLDREILRCTFLYKTDDLLIDPFLGERNFRAICRCDNSFYGFIVSYSSQRRFILRAFSSNFIASQLAELLYFIAPNYRCYSFCCKEKN
ncbi:hypothetical protein [Bacteroidetes bacterium endosymbiont of Geopemphigus sp.]|uniref:hypothetical protein n=1 Tax=Bacteroidetes bacterium endosymbiont of Geopemphigus sp. TaxID=2047937 RepID=UPI000CD17A94|nr:hypothetical protein [Bacteroidetes bacterium endosymbiont of Geopemphigus sp.]